MLVILKKQAIQGRVISLMGNRCEINVVTDDKEWANNVIESAILELRRIERLLTSINGNSQAYQINSCSGEKPVRIDKEVFNLVSRSLKISQVTAGAFDITRSPRENRFWIATRKHALVWKEKHVVVKPGDYKKIELDKKATTVFLQEKGMQIGFGDFGRGYAADRARMVLEQNGISGGVINVAGNLATWGNQPNGKPWTLYTADSNLRRHPFSFNISNMAVATAVNNGEYTLGTAPGQFESLAQLAPNTVVPRSTTIICQSAETATALASGISHMGIRSGLQLINGFRNVTCVIAGKNGALYTAGKSI